MKYDVLSLPILFVLILFNPVESKKCVIGQVCDPEDSECIKSGANDFYRQVIAGVPGVIKPSDPLYLNKITGQIRCVKYTLSNITMTGMKQCKVTKAIVPKGELVYEYTLYCPKLVISYGYDAEGNLGDIVIDGQGAATLTAIDYVIIFKVTNGVFISQKDNKCHFFIKSTQIETDPKGKLSLEASSLNEDKTKLEQALAYINCNPKILEDYLRKPVMPDLIIGVFMKNMDTYVRTSPVEEVFPKLEMSTD